MERDAAERIMPLVGGEASAIDVDAELLQGIAPIRDVLPAAGREQHAVPVEHVAARDARGNQPQARVVLEPILAVGLQRQAPARERRVGSHHLDPGQLHQHGGADRADHREQDAAGQVKRHAERGQGPRRGRGTAAQSRERGARRPLRLAEPGGTAGRERPQDPERGEMDDLGRTPVTQERSDHARERRQSRDTSGDEQHLEREAERQPQRQEHRVGLRGAARDPEAAQEEQREQPEAREQPQKAQLLADRSEDQVRVGRRHDGGRTESEPGARQAAGGKRPQPLRDLIAVRPAVLPRIEPHRRAQAHGAREADRVADREGAEHGDEPGEQEPGFSARDRIQRQEQREEQERGTQVALDEKQQHARGHPDHDREHVMEPRQLQDAQVPRSAERPLVQLSQQRPAAREVAGQEQHEEEADELHRLGPEQVHLGIAAGRSAPHGHERERAR